MFGNSRIAAAFACAAMLLSTSLASAKSDDQGPEPGCVRAEDNGGFYYLFFGYLAVEDHGQIWYCPPPPPPPPRSTALRPGLNFGVGLTGTIAQGSQIETSNL